jgi:hypothetical protein
MSIIRLIHKLKHHHPHPPHPHRAVSLDLYFVIGCKIVKGDHMLNEALVVGQSVAFVGVPRDANGNVSKATLSNFTFTSSAPEVATVSAPGPENVGVVVSVAAGSTTITETATATEPDGTTTEVIMGSATVVVTAVVVVPLPAVVLELVFGDPFPTGSTVQPPIAIPPPTIALPIAPTPSPK